MTENKKLSIQQYGTVNNKFILFWNSRLEELVSFHALKIRTLRSLAKAAFIAGYKEALKSDN